MSATLDGVKKALGITGDYLNDTIQEYFDEVVEYLKDAGVKESNITTGLVARGVSDLWNYNGSSTTGRLSQYFMQRATQLSYKG